MKKGTKVVLSVVLAGCAYIGWAAMPLPASRIEPVKPMPKDFIWGVSASSFQTEGGNMDSNWTRLNAAASGQDRYANAIDFLHRYREDIALAKDLGVNTFRVGIEWARVEPKKGQIDTAALAYYDDVFKAMKEAGIAPLVTLSHFTYPGWVSDQGGWVNPKTTEDYVKFTRLIAQRYHSDVHVWITFNETTLFILGETTNLKLKWGDTLRMRNNLVVAHREAYDLIHQIDPTAKVTTNIAWMGDHFGGGLLNGISDWLFLDKVEDKCDVIAIDYYAANLLKTDLTKHWTWPSEPPGLYRALVMLDKRYGKPILIAETGMATENGKQRADGLKREDVLRDSIYWTQRAQNEGVKVMGYMVWSLTDNFEWGSYTPRFGLYTVNVLTDPDLKRIPTAAVPAYRQAIREGGMPANYIPVLPQ